MTFSPKYFNNEIFFTMIVLIFYEFCILPYHICEGMKGYPWMVL